jgi:hypothetical protein
LGNSLGGRFRSTRIRDCVSQVAKSTGCHLQEFAQCGQSQLNRFAAQGKIRHYHCAGKPVGKKI